MCTRNSSPFFHEYFYIPAQDKLFREYIELELQLREFDRCRKLYEKFLEFAPANCSTWIKFAELETILGDPDRARAIFELAIAQSQLDMPEGQGRNFFRIFRFFFEFFFRNFFFEISRIILYHPL